MPADEQPELNEQLDETEPAVEAEPQVEASSISEQAEVLSDNDTVKPDITFVETQLDNNPDRDVDADTEDEDDLFQRPAFSVDNERLISIMIALFFIFCAIVWFLPHNQSVAYYNRKIEFANYTATITVPFIQPTTFVTDNGSYQDKQNESEPLYCFEQDCNEFSRKIGAGVCKFIRHTALLVAAGYTRVDEGIRSFMNAIYSRLQSIRNSVLNGTEKITLGDYFAVKSNFSLRDNAVTFFKSADAIFKKMVLAIRGMIETLGKDTMKLAKQVKMEAKKTLVNLSVLFNHAITAVQVMATY